MLSKYHVVVRLGRGLLAAEIAELRARRNGSISHYEMHGEDVVVVSLYAASSSTAIETAEIQVQRATGLTVVSVRVLTWRL
ncbi:hypothetical protein GCM10009672_24860 [Nesterenkonia lutea]